MELEDWDEPDEGLEEEDEMNLNLTFEKRGSEIKLKLQEKVAKLEEQVRERERRRDAILAERSFTPQEILEIASSGASFSVFNATYSNKMRDRGQAVGMEEVSKLEREWELLEKMATENQVARLTIEKCLRMERNLPDEKVFNLSYHDLAELEF